MTQAQETMRQVVVLGGGAAGTAMLIAASRMGALPSLCQAGLTIVEREGALGAGALGNYGINGDSTAETFFSAVAPSAGPELAALASHPAMQAVAARIGPDGGLPVPLADAAAMIDVIGADLARRITRAGGTIFTYRRALSTRQRGDGAWVTMVCDREGRRRSLVSRNVVIATGGWQPDDRLSTDKICGRTIAARAQERLMASGALLASGGPAVLEARLRDISAPRIVVIGSSTSALAACRVALLAPTAHVTLLHRRPLRVFYPSEAQALADGYTDFTPDDICPVSGFVYRLGGFRMEARDLVQRALRVGGRMPHPRLQTHHLENTRDTQAARMIDEADLVIHALGYRPRAVPVLDIEGETLPLAAEYGEPMVDANCRVLTAAGRPIPGLFGIGLAAGFVPSGKLGGEPSFSGQANGLWLWQNDAGAMIVDQLQPQAAQAVA